jgi:molybdenum cofactor cytidylyltransferase
MDGKFSAIILSGGYSSRMGAFKPLLPLGNATVVERAIELFRSAGIDDIRVVVGHRAEDLLPLLERTQVRPVLNDRYREGMFSSIVAGVASLDDDVEAFFLLPVDIPLVRVETITTLVQAYRNGACGIVYPCCHGRRGHPPLIAARYRDEILAWKGEGGLKPVLARNCDDSLDVDTGDEGILHDMDTPEDYGRLNAVMRKRGIPSVRECEAMLAKEFAAEAPLVKHSRAVSRLALSLSRRLNDAGCSLDLDLLAAAALLHDVARGRKDHAREGARLLAGLGYGPVAEVVAAHMDIELESGAPLGESEVLYLADKMTQRDRYVTVEQRFAPRLCSLASDADASRAARERLENALAIRGRIERRLGCPVVQVMVEDGLGSPENGRL